MKCKHRKSEEICQVIKISGAYLVKFPNETEQRYYSVLTFSDLFEEICVESEND